MSWAPLAEADDETQFGGKAAALTRAVRAGLPVPSGLALGAGFVEAVGSGDQSAEDELTSLPLPFGGGAAVRWLS